ncbi:SGNH/GDSL hydrolase family protein [Sphingomonas faeni]|uniref:SGNH/GDSL hydrolase family protein n=1 Tax=Sphingomonas faeni TaxID=185950 RepID=UPI00277EFAE6|nr:SGNH/GDSL hydrolase family protein [Sphingomonas faeni]MDQ0839398.1 hypothetical protein [Sphingomonas faeni]
MSVVGIYRDALFGNPPSPSTKPSREGSLAAFTMLAHSVSGAVAGIVYYATGAARAADTAKPVGTIGKAADEADYYRRESDGWVVDNTVYEGVAAVVQPLVDDAEQFSQSAGAASLASESAKTIIEQSASFSPRQLFGSDTKGGWWDPSDLTTLYQDVAKQIRVGVGDPVSVILDKSGNGNHLVCPGLEPRRPTLQRDTGGRLYLSFDGIDDLVRVNFATSVAVDRVSLVQPEAWTAEAQLFSGPSGSGILIMRPASPSIEMFASSDGPSLPISLTNPTIVTERYFGAYSKLSLGAGLPNIAAAGVSLANGFIVGGSAINTNYAQFRWYGSVMVDRQLSYSEIGRAQAYLNRAPLAMPVIISGDSTVADNGTEQPAIATFLASDLNVVASIATPGDTIQDQQTKFNALSGSVKQSARVIIVQIGLNNVINASTSPATVPSSSVNVALLQAYINTIRASIHREA